MNKQRRKELNQAIDALTAMKDELDALKVRAEPASELISNIISEERDYRENMPESLSDSEKATDADAAIALMEEVEEKLTELRELIDELDIDSLISKLDDAKGGAA